MNEEVIKISKRKYGRNRNPYQHKYARYNWAKLKMEFLAGDYISMSDFLTEKKIIKKGAGRPPQVSGWMDEKRAMMKLVVEGSKERIISDNIDDLIAIRKAQARQARYLQSIGGEALQSVDPKKIKVMDATNLVVKGLEQERRAIGIEGSTTKTNLTQININPKTNLDKMVEELDYVGTLKLIAELKRLGEESTSPTTSDKSTGKVKEGEVV